jgi:DNA gyrase subunit B
MFESRSSALLFLDFYNALSIAVIPDICRAEVKRVKGFNILQTGNLGSEELVATAKPSSSSYSAKDLSVLEGLDAVRKRPGMYIGSTDSRGLMHCLWEIVDNAVDEALAGYCKNIEILLWPDGSVEVKDDGRGIPVDVEKKSKLSGVELVMTTLHAGGKFGGGSYGASGGLHGVGASVVNALSERLDVFVDRDSKTYAMSFRRGAPGVFAGETPDAEFTAKSGLQIKGKVKAGKTGTRIRYWADPQLFDKSAKFDLAALLDRARQTAFLVPGLNLKIIDNREQQLDIHSFCFAGGISEFCQYLSIGEDVSNVIRLEGSQLFTENVQLLDSKGHMTTQEVERNLEVDIALKWGNGYEADVRSFVNIIATPKGGTHITGFERSITKVFNDQLRNNKVLKTSEDNVSKEDIQEGLTAIVTVRLSEPQFEGQTKEVLGTPAATKIVAAVVQSELTKWLTNPPRGEKVATKLVLEKVANAMRARVSARAQRDVQRRKNALESSTLPAKLRDCRGNDVERTELFIVEGESALGTAKDARNSEFQALLPIRGKILNVQKASVADMLKNTECAAIIQVIGAGSGRSFELENARYQKIILMSDADVDGAHIRCLLLTLIHRYMRPLLEAGRVYAAVPPLHRIDVMAGNKKPAEVVYTYSDGEMKAKLQELTKSGRKWKEPIQRYKGLGEMDAKQLRETTMDPRVRSLRRVTMSDAAGAETAFELLMGNEVAPRKEFIIEGSKDLDRSRIDA